MTNPNRTRVPALTALLLLLASLPLAAPATGQDAPAPETGYTIADAQGDVGVFFGSGSLPATLPETPVSNAADLREVGITGEDELGIHIYIQVQGFEPDPTAVDFLGRNGQAFYEFEAALAGTTIRYNLAWRVPLPGLQDTPSGVQPVEGRFCFFQGDPNGGPGRGSCNRQNVELSVDWDNDRVLAYVPKDSFMGRASLDGFPVAFPPLLTKGKQLTEILAFAGRDFPDFNDIAPNAGPSPNPYTFQVDAANTRIRLGLDLVPEIQINVGFDPGNPGGDFAAPSGPASNEVSVTPGVPSLVPIRVENLNAAKRIVNLSVAVEDPSQASHWSAQVVPTIQVPGGDARVVNLVVNATADTQHRDSAMLLVRGFSVTDPNELGALRVRLVATVPPGPDRSTLFFHAADFGTPDPLIEPLCGALRCGGNRFWLNTLETDPDATRDDGVPFNQGGFFFFGDGNQRFEVTFDLDTPITADLVLDTTKTVDVVLAFESDTQFPADFTAQVVTATGTIVATGGTQATIGSGPVQFTLVPLADQNRIRAAEGGFGIHLSLSVPLAGPGAASVLPSFRFIPGQSQAVLPFIPDPDAVLTVPGGTSFLTLKALNGPEEFVNPGETKIFNATLTNEGVEADAAHLEFTQDDPRWKVGLAPGSTFKLGPGESIQFSLLVTAPADAQENDRLGLLINATGASSAAAVSQLRFLAIVTSVDIPDEAGGYTASPEDKGKVVEEKEAGGTPGFEALLLVPALALAAYVVRRRRL